MRTAHGIYRTLQQYMEEADAGGFDEDIDMDFRSVSSTPVVSCLRTRVSSWVQVQVPLCSVYYPEKFSRYAEPHNITRLD